MEERKNRKFLLAYLVQLGIVILLTFILFLGNERILPWIFQPLGFAGIIITVIAFNAFAKQYK